MEGLLKAGSCLLLVVLVATQLLLASPYRSRLTDDSMNGRPIKTYETIIYKGAVTLEALGRYTPNSATLLINGDPLKVVDSFPVELSVCDGDVVEVHCKPGTKSFYLFLSARLGKVTTDSEDSTVLIQPGLNRLFKVFIAES